MSDTKFASFLKENKIDSRRLLAVSKKMEALTAADRKLKLSRRNKEDEAKKKPTPEETQAGATKSRSGRPVTSCALDSALHGKAVPGRTKTRILRAINKILEAKKMAPVDLRALF